MVEVIEFQKNTSKLLDVRYGKSSLKPVDDFWTDFTPHGGEKTTSFLPCICKNTPKNEEIVRGIQAQYAHLKMLEDSTERDILKLRNQLEK